MLPLRSQDPRSHAAHNEHNAKHQLSAVESSSQLLTLTGRRRRHVSYLFHPLSVSPNHFEIALRDSAARAGPNLIPLSAANNRLFGVGHNRLTHAAPPDCEIANPKRGA